MPDVARFPRGRGADAAEQNVEAQEATGGGSAIDTACRDDTAAIVFLPDSSDLRNLETLRDQSRWVKFVEGDEHPVDASGEPLVVVRPQSAFQVRRAFLSSSDHDLVGLARIANFAPNERTQAQNKQDNYKGVLQEKYGKLAKLYNSTDVNPEKNALL